MSGSLMHFKSLLGLLVILLITLTMTLTVVETYKF